MEQPVGLCDNLVPRSSLPPPLLTVLNYSGGQQSTAILWMVLLGEIERPSEFVVLNADPGMENSGSYAHVRAMMRRCQEAGIAAETVDGPNLYEDLVQVRQHHRIDNPPFYTTKPDGKRGRLRQKCTKHYKIAPMDRAIRRILHEKFGISLTTKSLGLGVVEKWIGFSHDEHRRVSLPSQRYVRFRWPLMEMGMTKADVRQFFIDRSLEVPPRSVCNACFANGLDTFKEMHADRPDDWAQAVAVDEAVRDLSHCGVDNPVFVSSSCVPLAELAERGFDVGADTDELSCDSGYCFT